MMKIGNVSLKNNVFLAPMAGVTDLAFRIICDRFGAGLSYTEMVSAKALSFSDKKTNALMQTDNLPTAVQLFGSDASIMADAVCEVEKHGLFTDINMGCPAPKIAGNGEGSALMRDLAKAEQIIGAVCEKATKPVTVKMRSGWDSEHINAVELARIAQNCGAAAVTVHPRTREQYYSGKADRSGFPVGDPCGGAGGVHRGGGRRAHLHAGAGRGDPRAQRSAGPGRGGTPKGRRVRRGAGGSRRGKKRGAGKG